MMLANMYRSVSSESTSLPRDWCTRIAASQLNSNFCPQACEDRVSNTVSKWLVVRDGSSGALQVMVRTLKIARTRSDTE